MRKIILTSLCLFMFLVSTAAVKKSAKPVKAAKVTASVLARELNETKIALDEMTAMKVSVTAKAVILEADIVKLKKEKSSMMIIFLITAVVALALAGFLIAGIAGKQASVLATRQKAVSGGTNQSHFDDIEAHVLDDWHNVWYHPEKINKELYEDLNNHYPELYQKIEKWKADISRRGVFAGHLISLLSTKFSDIEGTDSIYMLALSGSEPFIDETEIAVGMAICARLKRDIEGNSKMMKSYYDEAMEQFNGEFKEVKEVTNQIAVLKDEIDIDIRKIKHFRKIQGACKFIKV